MKKKNEKMVAKEAVVENDKPQTVTESKIKNSTEQVLSRTGIEAVNMLPSITIKQISAQLDRKSEELAEIVSEAVSKAIKEARSRTATTTQTEAEAIVEAIASEGIKISSEIIDLKEVLVVLKAVRIEIIEAVIGAKEIANAVTKVVVGVIAAEGEIAGAIAVAIEKAILEAAIVMLIMFETAQPNAEDETIVAVTRTKLRAQELMIRGAEKIMIISRAIAKLIAANPKSVGDVKKAVEEAEAEIEGGEDHYMFVGGRVPYMLVHLGILTWDQARWVHKEISQRHLNDTTMPHWFCEVSSLYAILKNMNVKNFRAVCEAPCPGAAHLSNIMMVKGLEIADAMRWLYVSVNPEEWSEGIWEKTLMRFRLFLVSQELSLTPIQQKVTGICIHFANRIRTLEGFGHHNIENKYETMMSYEENVEPPPQPAKKAKNGSSQPKNKATPAEEQAEERSKYDALLKAYFETIVEGVRNSTISDEQLPKLFSRDGAAKYLIKRHPDEFKADVDVKSVKDRLGRSSVWQNRNKVWAEIIGRKPLSLVETFGDQAFNEETGSRDGVNNADPAKAKYEDPVEDFLTSFRNKALLEGVPDREYVSKARKLTPKHVAEALKKQELFKNMEISTIASHVAGSQAWANRHFTLDVDIRMAHDDSTHGTDQ